MKTISFSFLIVAVIAGTCFGEQMEEIDFDSILGRYHRSGVELSAKISDSVHQGVVTNTGFLYSAALMHAAEPIPVLLEMLESQPDSENIPSSWIRISLLDYINNNWPSPRDARSPLRFYIVPPSPASAALTQMPISLQMLEAEIDSTETGSRRAELLAWIASAKYGTNFLALAETKAVSGCDQWKQIQIYALTNNLTLSPLFPVSQFRRMLPPTFIEPYERDIRILKKHLEDARKSGLTEEIEKTEAVLSEMGEPTAKMDQQSLAPKSEPREIPDSMWK